MSFTIRYTSVSQHARYVFKSLADAQRKYQQSSLMFREQNGLMRPQRAAVETWLTSDAQIKIKREARTNECSQECKHFKRLRFFGASRRRFLGTITVGLVPDSNNDLYITG